VTNSPQSVAITLRLYDGGTIPNASPISLGFTLERTTSQVTPATQAVNITVPAGQSWTVVKTGSAPWLTASASSGAGPSTINLSISPSAVGSGATFNAQLQISSPGIPWSAYVNVSLTVH
jgi:hypothetical protein